MKSVFNENKITAKVVSRRCSFPDAQFPNCAIPGRAIPVVSYLSDSYNFLTARFPNMRFLKFSGCTTPELRESGLFRTQVH
jgi:hypothetical protein